MKMYYDDDVDAEVVADKTIAVIGYGSQGRGQSRNMADMLKLQTLSTSYYLMKPKKKFTKNKSLLMLKLETPFHSLTVTTFTLA